MGAADAARLLYEALRRIRREPGARHSLLREATVPPRRASGPTPAAGGRTTAAEQDASEGLGRVRRHPVVAFATRGCRLDACVETGSAVMRDDETSTAPSNYGESHYRVQFRLARRARCAAASTTEPIGRLGGTPNDGRAARQAIVRLRREVTQKCGAMSIAIRNAVGEPADDWVRACSARAAKTFRGGHGFAAARRSRPYPAKRFDIVGFPRVTPRRRKSIGVAELGGAMDSRFPGE